MHDATVAHAGAPAHPVHFDRLELHEGRRFASASTMVNGLMCRWRARVSNAQIALRLCGTEKGLTVAGQALVLVEPRRIELLTSTMPL
jgi:hypothetical protein